MNWFFNKNNKDKNSIDLLFKNICAYSKYLNATFNHIINNKIDGDQINIFLQNKNTFFKKEIFKNPIELNFPYYSNNNDFKVLRKNDISIDIANTMKPFIYKNNEYKIIQKKPDEEIEIFLLNKDLSYKEIEDELKNIYKDLHNTENFYYFLSLDSSTSIMDKSKTEIFNKLMDDFIKSNKMNKYLLIFTLLSFSERRKEQFCSLLIENKLLISNKDMNDFFNNFINNTTDNILNNKKYKDEIISVQSNLQEIKKLLDLNHNTLLSKYFFKSNLDVLLVNNKTSASKRKI